MWSISPDENNNIGLVYCVVAVIVWSLSESSMVKCQWIGLQCVVVACLAHPHFLLAKIYDIEEIALKCN